MLRRIQDSDERFGSAGAGMEGMIAAADTKFEGQVGDLKKRIHAVQDNVVAIGARVDTVEAHIENVEARFRDLKAHVRDLEAEPEGINDEVKNLKARVGSLETVRKRQDLELTILVHGLSDSDGKATLNVTRESLG
ncbi:hypothetical protein QCA50_013853 [Cerrena zonata]|uniref:Uncharacterized protein n=1 Tax=Cerrena zonata TaxID=2478898 RepID=A0AAW0FWA1_9APHY